MARGLVAGLAGLLATAVFAAGYGLPAASADETAQTVDDTGEVTRQTPEVTAHDGKYTITFSTMMGSTLEGKTIEARRVATVSADGELEPVDAMLPALQAAGGQGENPAQDLLQQIADYTIAPEELAQKLYPNVKGMDADATTPGRASDDVVQASMEVEPGWYVVDAAGVDGSSPEMVLAADVSGMDQNAMTGGIAFLDGVYDGSVPQDRSLGAGDSKGLLDSLSTMSLFAQPRAKNNTVDYDAGYKIPGTTNGVTSVNLAWNADFKAHFNNNTYHAFCLNPTAIQANSGSSYNVSAWPDNRIRTALWYGYMGPQSIFDSTKYVGAGSHVSASAQDQMSATHLYVAAVYMGKSTANPTFGKFLTGARVVKIPGYTQIKEKAEKHPLPSNVDFQPYIMFAKAGSKTSTDWWDVNNVHHTGPGELKVDDKHGASVAQPIIFAVFNSSSLSISTEMTKNITVSGTNKVQDSIKLTVTGGKGWKKGEQIALRTRFRWDRDGNGKDNYTNAEKVWVYTNPKDLKTGQSVTIKTAWFGPTDIGHTGWQNGKYWFDTAVSVRFTKNSNGTVTFDKGMNYSPSLGNLSKTYDGFLVDSENMSVSTVKVTGSTEASASNVSTANANAVSDKITLSTDSPIDLTVSKVDVTLNYKGWNGTKSATKTVRNVTIPANDSVTFWSGNFIPKDLWGSTSNWRNGSYWFDVKIDGTSILNSQSKKPVQQPGAPLDIFLDGSNDKNEQFKVQILPNNFYTQARNTFNKAQGSMPVHDDVVSQADVDVKGTVTLNWDGDGDGKADKSKKSAEFTIKAWDTSSSPDFTPADLGLTDGQWQGGDYWFDLDIPKQTGIDGDLHFAGRDDGRESWSSTGFEYMKAWTTSQASNGLAANWNNADVSNGTRFTARTANLVVEGGTQNLTDSVRLNVQSLTGDRRSWDTDGDGYFDGNLKFTVKTTLHAPNGKTSSLYKDYGSYYSKATSGSATFSFAPSSVGMTTWQHGDYYFTSVVTGVKGASNNSGLACPANAIPVNGVKDDHLLCLKDYQTESSPLAASESVYIAPRFQPAISTKVTDATLDNGYPSWDDVTVTLPVTVSGLDVPVQGSLYWSPTKGVKSNTIPANAKKVADTKGLTFTSRGFTKSADGKSYVQTIRFKASSDANLKSVKNLGTGWYTYVWRIDKSGLAGKNVTVSWDYHGKGWWKTLTYKSDQLLAGMPDTISDGWQPDTEQTQMNAKWRLAIEKVGHIGQKNGAFLDTRPAAGAKLSMQETTDATGKTLKPGTTASSITLNSDGKGTFAYQTIEPGQTRYYRVWETKVDKPFNIPKDGGYWIVTATNQMGSVGVHKVISNGSTEETKWLLHDAPEGDTTDRGVSTGSGVKNDPIIWTQKLGDTYDANVMPPTTGDAHDALMTLTLTGLATLLAGVVAALILRRRMAGGR